MFFILLVGLLSAYSALGARPRWRDLPVSAVVSSSFSGADLEKIKKGLGIAVGQPLIPEKMDEGIRKLVKEAMVESLFVDVQQQGTRLQVDLRGRIPQKIRDIKFSGIPNDIIEEARGNIVLKAGEITDSRILAELKEQVKDAFHRRGFYEVQVVVKVRPIAKTQSADVEISAVAGTRTLVAKVNMLGVETKLVPELLEVFGLKKGAPFELDKLEQRMRMVTEYLRQNRYYGARLEQRTLEYNEDRSEVTINLFIKLGNRYQFVLTGNTVFPEWQLREFLNNDELQSINAVSNVASQIERKYQEVGYHFCKVNVREEFNEYDHTNIVYLEIEEGPKVRIGRVDFSRRLQLLGSGIGMKDKELSKLFFEGAPGVLSRKLYWEQGFQEAVRNFSSRLNEMGFSSARIGEPKTFFSENKERADIFVDIELGTRTKVTGIQCINNHAYENKELIAKLPFRVGDDYNPSRVEEGVVALTLFYQKNGYVDVKVENDPASDLQISRDQESALIKFRIEEGLQFRVNQVAIEGNTKTQDSVIERKLKVKAGGLFSPQAVAESEEAISLLGLFSRVEILAEDTPDKPGFKDVTVSLREIAPGLAEFGAGATYEDPLFRLRAFGGVGYSNLFGLNNTSTVRGEIRFPISGSKVFPFLEYFATLGYVAPYIGGLPANLSAQFGLDSFQVAFRNTSRDLKTRARFELKLEKVLSRRVTTFFRIYRLERTNIETFDLNHVLLTSEKDTIGSTGPGIIIDLRNDLFNPTKGSYHLFDIEFAHPYLLSESNIAFVMALSRNSFYFPLVAPFSMQAFVAGGYARSLFGNAAIPRARLVNELSLGGQPSIRGFTIRQFQPDGNARETAFINARVELGILLAEKFKLVAFADSGQLFPKLSNSTSYNRHDGVGIGARYLTPVGPLAVDFAHGMGPDGKSLQFYFSIGSL